MESQDKAVVVKIEQNNDDCLPENCPNTVQTLQSPDNNILESTEDRFETKGSCTRIDQAVLNKSCPIERDDEPLDAMILQNSELMSEDVIDLAYKQELK